MYAATCLFLKKPLKSASSPSQACNHKIEQVTFEEGTCGSLCSSAQNNCLEPKPKLAHGEKRSKHTYTMDIESGSTSLVLTDSHIFQGKFDTQSKQRSCHADSAFKDCFDAALDRPDWTAKSKSLQSGQKQGEQRPKMAVVRFTVVVCMGGLRW